MYRIIGIDGRQYGPVTAEQVREWIAGGRVNGQTSVQPEGGTEWKPLAGFPEFADALAAKAASAAPSPCVPPTLAAPPPATNADALAADIVLAARSAYFLVPQVPQLGAVPDLGATWTALDSPPAGTWSSGTQMNLAVAADKVNPNLVARDAEGKVFTVRYEAVNAMLLNEFLKEHRRVDAEVKTNAEHTKTIAEQENRIRVLSDAVAALKARDEAHQF